MEGERVGGKEGAVVYRRVLEGRRDERTQRWLHTVFPLSSLSVAVSPY